MERTPTVARPAASTRSGILKTASRRLDDIVYLITVRRVAAQLGAEVVDDPQEPAGPVTS